MLEFIGDRVWSHLPELAAAARRRRAAIAYVGREAQSLLHLAKGDVIVIDGSDAALRAGVVNPETVAAWLHDGVAVRNLPGLHAKILLLDGEPDLAIVGSANASAHSRDYLLEAAIVTDDADVVEKANAQFNIWFARAEQVGPAWLANARRTYRPATRNWPRKEPAASQPDTSTRWWIGEGLDAPQALSLTEQAAYDALVATQDSDAYILPWRIPSGDPLREGDTVVLVNQANDAVEAPHGRNKAWPPAVVAQIVPGSRQSCVAFLVVNDGTLPSTTYARVRDAIANSGAEIDWDVPLPPVAVKALRALWEAGR